MISDSQLHQKAPTKGVFEGKLKPTGFKKTPPSPAGQSRPDSPLLRMPQRGASLDDLDSMRTSLGDSKVVGCLQVVWGRGESSKQFEFQVFWRICLFFCFASISFWSF